MSLRSLSSDTRFAVIAVLPTWVFMSDTGRRHNAGRLALAVCGGTIVGLGVKYLLDKRWIFHTAARASDHRPAVLALCLTGVFTTAIFWLGEFGFWYVWQTHFMRELGAVIGLSLGYITKYRLIGGLCLLWANDGSGYETDRWGATRWSRPPLPHRVGNPI